MTYWWKSLGTITCPRALLVRDTSGWAVENMGAREKGDLLEIQSVRGRPWSKRWQRRTGLLLHLCGEPGIAEPSSLQRRLKDTLQNPALHCLPVRQGPSFGNTGLWHTSSLLGLLNAVQPTDTFISQQVHCARLRWSYLSLPQALPAWESGLARQGPPRDAQTSLMSCLSWGSPSELAACEPLRGRIINTQPARLRKRVSVYLAVKDSQINTQSDSISTALGRQMPLNTKLRATDHFTSEGSRLFRKPVFL